MDLDTSTQPSNGDIWTLTHPHIQAMVTYGDLTHPHSQPMLTYGDLTHPHILAMVTYGPWHIHTAKQWRLMENWHIHIASQCWLMETWHIHTAKQWCLMDLDTSTQPGNGDLWTLTHPHSQAMVTYGPSHIHTGRQWWLMETWHIHTAKQWCLTDLDTSTQPANDAVWTLTHPHSQQPLTYGPWNIHTP